MMAKHDKGEGSWSVSVSGRLSGSVVDNLCDSDRSAGARLAANSATRCGWVVVGGGRLAKWGGRGLSGSLSPPPPPLLPPH